MFRFRRTVISNLLIAVDFTVGSTARFLHFSDEFRVLLDVRLRILQLLFLLEDLLFQFAHRELDFIAPEVRLVGSWGNSIRKTRNFQLRNLPRHLHFNSKWICGIARLCQIRLLRLQVLRSFLFRFEHSDLLLVGLNFPENFPTFPSNFV
jgi:hypothetical protein